MLAFAAFCGCSTGVMLEPDAADAEAPGAVIPDDASSDEIPGDADPPDDAAEGETQPTPDDPGPFVVFVDEGWGGTTTDVHDVDDEIVRFNAANRSLVWAADGHEFDGWPAEGLFLGPNAFFQVRFGVKDGRRLAFFTETGPATICDVRVVEGQLGIFPTDVIVPE
ncbi:MAG: hypothetical protein HOP29_19895 [Phycisphaerales bacterium]|nr:hypothetical protein [Phycisphaerales bacterium]